MTAALSANASTLFPTLLQLVDKEAAFSALRCVRDMFPAQHQLDGARTLRQRAVLIMAQCSDVRGDRQSARRDPAELQRLQKDLDTRTREFVREAERYAKNGAVPEHVLERIAINAQQALSDAIAADTPSTPGEAPHAIFISYRRTDSKNTVGFIADRLQQRFGEDRIFWDIDSIPPGVDFRAYIVSRVSQCTACLVVIGPNWLNATHADGRRRIDDANDLVRVEVETALRLNIPVAPVLVEDGRMPSAKEMPESLASLPGRHGMVVRPPPDFDIDIERLMNRLADRLG
jgi:hypothetical protein